jgi:hypothetical protein
MLPPFVGQLQEHGIRKIPCRGPCGLLDGGARHPKREDENHHQQFCVAHVLSQHRQTTRIVLVAVEFPVNRENAADLLAGPFRPRVETAGCLRILSSILFRGTGESTPRKTLGNFHCRAPTAIHKDRFRLVFLRGCRGLGSLRERPWAVSLDHATKSSWQAAGKTQPERTRRKETAKIVVTIGDRTA